MPIMALSETTTVQLAQALRASTDPDPAIRGQAEAFLKAGSNQIQLLVHLIQLIEADSDVSAAASILLKNEIRQYWEDTSTTDLNEDDHPTTPKLNGYKIQDKIPVGAALYPLVKKLVARKADGTVRKEVLETLRLVVYFDYPKIYCDLLKDILEDVADLCDSYRLWAGLLALRTIASKYTILGPSEDEYVDTILGKSLSVLLRAAAALSEEGMANIDAMMLLKLVLKIYESFTKIALGSFRKVSQEVWMESMEVWMELIHRIIMAPVPSELLVLSRTQKNEHVQFKLKKWAMYITLDLINRLVVVSWADQEVVQVKYMKIVAPVHLEACIVQLKDMSASGSVLGVYLKYITLAVEVGNLYKRCIQPSLHELLFQVCFRMLCYTAEDEESWQADPLEFFRTHVECAVVCETPHECAGRLVAALGRYRAHACVQEIGNFASNVISNAQTDNREKYAAFIMMGRIASRLCNEKRGLSMADFLCVHAVALLSSPDKFVRLRCCWMLETFLAAPKKIWMAPRGASALPGLFDLLLERCQDAELPVKLQAAITLGSLAQLGHDVQTLKEHLKQNIESLMTGLFRLVQECDHEQVVASLESFVRFFDVDVHPYARQLMEVLSSNVLKLALADETIQAFTTVQAIKSVLGSVSESPSLYPEFLTKLTPLLLILFHPSFIYFLDDVLEVLNVFVVHLPAPLSGYRELWRFVQYIHLALCGVDRGGDSNTAEDQIEIFDKGWGECCLSQYCSFLCPLIIRSARDPAPLCTLDQPVLMTGAHSLASAASLQYSGEALQMIATLEANVALSSARKTYKELIVELALKSWKDNIEIDSGTELFCVLASARPSAEWLQPALPVLLSVLVENSEGYCELVDLDRWQSNAGAVKMQHPSVLEEEEDEENERVTLFQDSTDMWVGKTFSALIIGDARAFWLIVDKLGETERTLQFWTKYGSMNKL